MGEAFNAFGQTAPVSSLSLIHPVAPAGSPLLAVWSGAGSKARNMRRMGETCQRHKTILPRDSAVPTLPGMQAGGSQEAGGGKCPGRADSPWGKRKRARQAISLEHNVLAEVST